MSTEAPVRPAQATKSWMAGLGQISDAAGNTIGKPAAPPAGGDPGTDPGEGGGTQPGATQPPKGQQPGTQKPAAGQPAGQPAGQKQDGAAGAAGDDRWPRSAQEWKKFREERDKQRAELEDRIKALTSEVETFKGAPPGVDPKEFEKLKGERDDLDQRLRVTNIERHPKFEAYFKKKVDDQIAMAKHIVGQEKAAAIEEALRLAPGPYRDKMIEEVISELPPLRMTQFGAILNSLEATRMERDQEIANAAKTYEDIVAGDKAAAAERRKTLEKVFDESVSNMTKDMPIFATKTGDDAWNAEVAKRIEGAKSLLFNNSSPQALVNTVLQAAAYGPMLKALQFATAEAAKLKQQVADMMAANPGGSPGGSPEGGDQPPPRTQLSSSSRPMEVARSWMKGLPKINGQ